MDEVDQLVTCATAHVEQLSKILDELDKKPPPDEKTKKALRLQYAKIRAEVADMMERIDHLKARLPRVPNL